MARKPRVVQPRQTCTLCTAQPRNIIHHMLQIHNANANDVAKYVEGDQGLETIQPRRDGYMQPPQNKEHM